ncbi:leucine-rich repeat and WD repeat-containing protein 1 [Salmo trutta]|uniref:Leucine-rich repeat and WD repeat-containing protein 1 n=1 Tax=Salmo trutta TaxID=8032 RepID=A0A673W020_SALTR|nr:leucine-rich repeat and WD repeat-containing protein 1 [Salmo trutta]
MAKITEKLLLEKCTPKNTNLEQVKALNLSKLGLKSSDLPVPLLSRLHCLEQLDLSGNKLQEMPSGLFLPSLRSLDLTNNEMEDVTTLDTLTTLEDLRMEDNLYITVNDNYKLMILLPKLRFYNGKDISTTANHIRHVNSEDLRKRVLALWETSFSLPDHRTAEKLAIVERDFVNAVRHKVKYGPSSLTDYIKWRVEMIAKEHLRSLTEPNEEYRDTEEPADTKENCSFPFPAKRKRSASAVECDVTLHPQKIARASVQAEDSPRRSIRLQSIPHKAERHISTMPRTHKAAQIPATPTRDQSKLLVIPRNALREKQHQSKEDMPLAKQTRKSARQHWSTEVNETPGKVICTKSQHSSQEPVSLQPLHVLQCHSKQDSPDDFSTQLWACSFQPLQDYYGDVNGATRIVATCGGESVCLIDCETGLVMKKYKVPGEDFFSLAWSTVLMSRKGNVAMRPCSILAAGGKRGLVKLLHPRANMAYGEFRASRKALSILCFSPRQGNLLFTGSYDKKILMWDIGGVDSKYNFKVTQLLVLETTSTPLHFCLPPATPDTHLIAACEEGLHSYNIQHNKDPKKRSEEMEITFPVYEKDKDHDYHTIDGLGFVTNDVVASKSHMQGSIYLWSWNDTRAQLPNNKKKKKKKEVCAVILAELQWSSTDIAYLSLNTCPSKGYVVCGDERGRLWTYHVTDLLKANFRSGKAIPATEILAWPLPVRKGQSPVEGPAINSVAMDPELRYLVALSDKNMAVVWIRTESS